MTPAFYIALRFIVSRKRAFVTSMIGVVCGVAFFICAQAQTQGFEEYFVQTVLGSRGSIVISDRFQSRYTQFEGTDSLVVGSGQQRRKYYDGIDDPYRVIRMARSFSSVLGAAPVVHGSISITSSFQTEIVRLEGIDLRYHLQTTSLHDQIIAGSINHFRSHPFAVILGSLLADKLQVKSGDNVVLTAVDGSKKTFSVAAIFRSGVNMIDSSCAYTHIKIAQSLLDKPSAASTIIVRLRNPDRAPQIAEHFERLFHHRSRSWQEREKGNLQVFKTLRVSAAITVSLIILLAGFGIFNVLTLTVLDKVREIAILRSMGYRRRDILAIFLWQGILIAALGSLLGAVLGAALTYGISLIPLKIRGILYADHFVVSWSAWHYVSAIMIAFIAVLAAAIFPRGGRRAFLLCIF
ncbi:MAG: FtsX-like permease family protein [bacterium]